MSIVLPNVGDRVRVAIQYNEVWRPLAWLRVGKDGSIYLGLLTGRPSVAHYVGKPGSKTVHIKYEEARELPDVPSSSRVSFKASGEIHLAEKVLRGTPLDSLQKPRQLCLMMFVHPSRYIEPSTKNPKDYETKPPFCIILTGPRAEGRG